MLHHENSCLHQRRLVAGSDVEFQHPIVPSAFVAATDMIQYSPRHTSSIAADEGKILKFAGHKMLFEPMLVPHRIRRSRMPPEGKTSRRHGAEIGIAELDPRPAEQAGPGIGVPVDEIPQVRSG